jgi:hypothetical protein
MSWRCAIARSSVAVIAPATPIAPAISPSASTGSPPATRAMPGRFANDATAAGSVSIARLVQVLAVT